MEEKVIKKTIVRITDDRMNEVLPSVIQQSECLSKVSKKTLAALINCYLTIDKAKKDGYVVYSNVDLSKVVGCSMSNLLLAIQELIETNLITRVKGQKRASGQKAIASMYYINWANLKKPVYKPTAEELIEMALKEAEELNNAKSSETPLSIANTNTNSYTNSDTKSNTNSKSNIESNINTKSDTNIDTKIESNIESKFDIESNNKNNNLKNNFFNNINNNNLEDTGEDWLSSTSIESVLLDRPLPKKIKKPSTSIEVKKNSTPDSREDWENFFKQSAMRLNKNIISSIE